MRAATTGQGPTKIPARSVLCTCSDGRVDVLPAGVTTPSPGMTPWKFSKGKELVVAEGAVTTLGEFIANKGADALFSHAPFVQGTAPPSFALKKAMYFQASAPGDLALLAAAAASKSVKVFCKCRLCNFLKSVFVFGSFSVFWFLL